ncbi:MAG: ribonuclease H [Patescibacteria group bacterium]|nr:ribonuclease HI [Patescibacteria group bacterium]
MIKIYTDGSCLGNPGPGGWAAIVLHDGNEVELYGNEKDTTNNRMEIISAVEALKWVRNVAKINENNQKEQIKIYADSSLLVKTINENWKRKKNQDLWGELDKARGFLNIKWEWVKGHHEDKYNNKADKLALEQAKLLQP